MRLSIPRSLDLLMRAFNGSAEERFEKILSQPLAGSDCDAAEKLLPLAQAMYREAASLATTTTEQRIVASNLLFEVERRTLGEEAAAKNAGARLRELRRRRRGS